MWRTRELELHVDKKLMQSKTVQMSEEEDKLEKEKQEKENEEKERVLAAKASREMWTAILVIVGSFVFVLVAAALIVVIGHIQLF